MRISRCLASAAVSCCAACWFLLGSVTFVPVSAVDTVTLNSDWFQTHLPSFTVDYYSFDGSYKKLDFGYRSRQYWTSDISHIDTPSNFSGGVGFLRIGLLCRRICIFLLRGLFCNSISI